MGTPRSRTPWGRRGPAPGEIALLACGAVALFLLLRWVWASVVGVYFSSIIVLPGYGFARTPDFAGMFFHALTVAALITLLVLILIAAALALLLILLEGHGHHGGRHRFPNWPRTRRGFF